MEHPVDLQQLPEASRRALGGPAPLRMMVARGMAPLPPVALVSALYVLAYDPDEKLREAAQATLAKLPEPVLNGALGSPELPGAVLDDLVARFAPRPDVIAKALRHGAIFDDTVVRVATACDEAICEVIATNEQRLLRCPAIIEALYFNQSTRMSTADRIVEFAARNGLKLAIPGFDHIVAALRQQLIPEPSPEPLPSDEIYSQALREAATVDSLAVAMDEDEDGELEVPESARKVEKSITDMSVTEKIRTAMIGTSTQRALLVRSPNRIVAAAVLDSPKLTEDEVAKFAASRSVSEDVLRTISNRREWLKNYDVKLQLVNNPKTPLAQTLRLLNYLHEHDVKKLVSSKNIPAALRTAAVALMNKRKPRN